MQELLLALGVVVTILSISSVRSAKLKAALYTLPIPITIILIGTGNEINATHLFSLLLVIFFFILTWCLYKKLKINIILSIILALIGYVLTGILNQIIINIPFALIYASVSLGWVTWIILQPLSHIRAKDNIPNLQFQDYAIRGITIFGLTYFMVGIRELILGAAVTFPFNGIFTAYIMRDSLLYLVNEVIRNFIGIINFFGIIYLLQGHLPTWICFASGWFVCVVSILIVYKFLPRKSLLIKNLN